MCNRHKIIIFICILDSEDEEEYLKEDKVHVMTSQGIMKTSIKSGDRYSLQFAKESKRELERRKDQAFQSLQYIHLQDQEVSNNYYPLEVDIPKRPPWDYSMTKAKLESREQTYFAVCYFNEPYLFTNM